MARSNRLAEETSPYLLLHQNNPVDWYPWGPEALRRAREENKPIFLSVGYATCFWCHVMERESFADAGTAALMNEHFINVKVDREERPDLDEIYMAATQLFTQQGGWPNSVFLTPELRPFFAGTYFPLADRHGRPSFRTVLLSMHNAWTTRREDVMTQAAEMAKAMGQMLEERGTPREEPALSEEVVEAAKAGLVERFDAAWGGFGNAPKFPSPANLHLLLDLAEDGDEEAAEMVTVTLDRMGRGGVYDQLAGGFHRYATDREWKVPHFEKMLYDNGQLLEIYARDYARTGDPERARIVRETAAFLGRELTSSAGGLWSAIDAEVAGREGDFHVWSLEQIVEVLGEEDAGFLAPLLGFDGEPFFDREFYVLHLPEPLEVQAERRRTDPGQLLRQVRDLEAKLLAAREERERPLVDDKVLCDWNGMTLAGLAVAAGLLDDVGLLRQAEKAADFVVTHLRSPGGTLCHAWRAGTARIDAFLSDYVFLVHGLLALYEAAGDERWLAEAARLTEEQIDRLHDSETGGFFGAGSSEDLIFRSKEVFDGALPATNAMAVLNLIALARHQEERAEGWLALAEKTLAAFAELIASRPAGCRMLALATRRFHAAVKAPSDTEAAAATVARLVEKAAQAVISGSLKVAGRDPQQARAFTLELRVKKGWHVGAAHGSDGSPSSATRLEISEGELLEVHSPGGEPLAGNSGASVYSGTVLFEGLLRSPREKPSILLHFQPCDDRRCLSATSKTFEAEIEAVN